MIPAAFYLKCKRPSSTDNHYNDPTRKVKQLCLIIPLLPPHVEHQLVAFQPHTGVDTVAGREDVTPARHPMPEGVARRFDHFLVRARVQRAIFSPRNLHIQLKPHRVVDGPAQGSVG